MLQKCSILNRENVRKLVTQTLRPQKEPKGKWKSVVGLEVHAQIASKSKLFSGSGTAFGEPLNDAVSLFDASIPGTLPVLNQRCVEVGVKTALALASRVNTISMFDRKHYFYADLPTGYQITQQRAALANDGEITFPVIVPGKKVYYKKVRLLQLQLEQDSGKSLHDDILKRSLVDLNRAGVPLMELVFAPDLETGEEAASLIKELILIFRRLQACSCKMEEGALRVDANVSVHRENEPFGIRTEVKNIGSVRSVAQAISYEIDRQLNMVAEGGTITNETRAWDADAKRTVAMRDKEVLQDYRFMPDPNLPPLRLNTPIEDLNDGSESIVSIREIENELPELPEHTRQTLINKFKLSQETAIILVNDPVLLKHFDSVMEEISELPAKLVANFLINDVLTYCNKANIDMELCALTSTHLKVILKALHSGEINLQSARRLIELLHMNPASTVNELIQQHQMQQISNADTIEKLCSQAIQNQPKSVKQYQSGKTKAFFAIVGEVAKLSQERADMKAVVDCLKKMLDKK